MVVMYCNQSFNFYYFYFEYYTQKLVSYLKCDTMCCYGTERGFFLPAGTLFEDDYDTDNNDDDERFIRISRESKRR